MAKELNQPITTLSPVRVQRANKFWAIAQGKPDKQLKVRNECTEHAYQRIITFIKQQHLKPEETFFERNYKRDKDDGLCGMHSFITSTFYWRLDCPPHYSYEVEFAFENCPYEADVRHMLRAYPLDRQATEKILQPNFKTFYETVLTVQDKQYIGSLTNPLNRQRL
jgi:hypothetical protein